jgi:hypothetical protein
MKINGIPFLIIISRNIQHHTAEWLPFLDINAYRNVLECIFAIYSKAAFSITQINWDKEYCPPQDKIYIEILNKAIEMNEEKVNNNTQQEHPMYVHERDGATITHSGSQVNVPITFCKTSNAQLDTSVEYGV